MKISTKGRYGLIAMVDLAVYSSQGSISLNSIAERQQISEHYLEQLFSLLKKAGLVNSTRGAQGGYTIARGFEKITVGEILRALEGPLVLVDCLCDNSREECERADYCITRKVWDRISSKINEVADSVTLQDLVEDYKRRNYSDYLMYYI